MASRNLYRDRLEEFRSTRAIVQFSFYASKRPRPERLRDIDDPLIDRAILVIRRWNPKRRYLSGNYVFLLVLRLPAHEIACRAAPDRVRAVPNQCRPYLNKSWAGRKARKIAACLRRSP